MVSDEGPNGLLRFAPAACGGDASPCLTVGVGEQQLLLIQPESSVWSAEAGHQVGDSHRVLAAWAFNRFDPAEGLEAAVMLRG